MQHVIYLAMQPEELTVLIGHHDKRMSDAGSAAEYLHHQARRDELIRQRNGRFDQYGNEVAA